MIFTYHNSNCGAGPGGVRTSALRSHHRISCSKRYNIQLSRVHKRPPDPCDHAERSAEWASGDHTLNSPRFRDSRPDSRDPSRHVMWRSGSSLEKVRAVHGATKPRCHGKRCPVTSRELASCAHRRQSDVCTSHNEQTNMQVVASSSVRRS